MGCCFQMMPHCLHRTSQLMRRCALSVEGGVCTMRWMHLDRLQRQDFFFFLLFQHHSYLQQHQQREGGRERGRRAALCDSLVSSDTSLRKCFCFFKHLSCSIDVFFNGDLSLSSLSLCWSEVASKGKCGGKVLKLTSKGWLCKHSCGDRLAKKSRSGLETGSGNCCRIWSTTSSSPAVQYDTRP